MRQNQFLTVFFPSKLLFYFWYEFLSIRLYISFINYLVNNLWAVRFYSLALDFFLFQICILFAFSPFTIWIIFNKFTCTTLRLMIFRSSPELLIPSHLLKISTKLQHIRAYHLCLLSHWLLLSQLLFSQFFCHLLRDLSKKIKESLLTLPSLRAFNIVSLSRSRHSFHFLFPVYLEFFLKATLPDAMRFISQVNLRLCPHLARCDENRCISFPLPSPPPVCKGSIHSCLCVVQ